MKTILFLKLKDYKNSLPIILVMSGMALLFIYIFGNSLSTPYVPKVNIIDDSHSVISDRVIKQIVDSDQFEFSITTFEESIQQLEKNKVLASVVISENLTPTIYSAAGQSIEYYMLKKLISTSITQVVEDSAFANNIEKYSKQIAKDHSMKVYEELTEQQDYPVYSVEMSKLKESGSDYTMRTHSFMGFIIFFSLFVIFFGIGSLVEDKKLRIWHRQIVSPLRPKDIISGNFIATFLVGLSQILGLVIISKYLFSINWGGSTFGILLVMTAYVIAMTSIGLFISRFAKSQQQLAAIIPILTVSTSMIGGCMWPLDIIQSRLLLFLAKLTPQNWALEGLKRIIVDGGTIKDVWIPTVVLMFFGIIFFLFAIPGYRGGVISD